MVGGVSVFLVVYIRFSAFTANELEKNSSISAVIIGYLIII